jgi:hypothetical protein
MFPKEFPIAPHFSPTCFDKCCPPKENNYVSQNRTFCCRGDSIVFLFLFLFGSDGPIKLAHYSIENQPIFLSTLLQLKNGSTHIQEVLSCSFPAVKVRSLAVKCGSRAPGNVDFLKIRRRSIASGSEPSVISRELWFPGPSLSHGVLLTSPCGCHHT